MLKNSLFISLVLGCWLCVWQQPAHAHAVHWSVTHGDGYAVAFVYADGSPCAYAFAKVFSPEDASVEFMAGNADKNGVVAFAPQVQGDWRVEVNDGMGHKAVAVIQVSQKQPDAVAPLQRDNSLPTVWGAVLGLSLLVNLFGIAYWWLRKKSKGA